jgi:hypothetical protein
MLAFCTVPTREVRYSLQLARTRVRSVPFRLMSKVKSYTPSHHLTLLQQRVSRLLDPRHQKSPLLINLSKLIICTPALSHMRKYGVSLSNSRAHHTQWLMPHLYNMLRHQSCKLRVRDKARDTTNLLTELMLRPSLT